MKVKVFLPYGYKILHVTGADGIQSIAKKYLRWEYVS